MVTSGNELTEIVGRVVEPELRRDLHTMGMLREVSLTSGTVHVVVALPSEDWPATETLTNLIETSIATQEGVKAVSV